MQINVVSSVSGFQPVAITIVADNPLDLDLLKRIAGLNRSIPRALNDRNDTKARAAAFLDDLKSALEDLS